MTADLTADEARQLTDRITGQVANLLPLIREAFERRAWIALGHESWDAYCDTRLRGLRLPVERREAALELVGSGMSRRSAAAALGVDERTIRRDVAEAQLRHDAAVAAAPDATEVQADVRHVEPIEPEVRAARSTPVDVKAAAPAATAPILGADGRRRQPPSKRPDLGETPEARAAAARNAVRKGVQAFLPVVAGLPPERVAEVADDALWLELTHCRDRFIEWTDEIFAIRRRQSMHAVKKEAV
jgi:hypothetical protein